MKNNTKTKKTKKTEASVLNENQEVSNSKAKTTSTLSVSSNLGSASASNDSKIMESSIEAGSISKYVTKTSKSNQSSKDSTELDAWFGSYPEDLKKIKSSNDSKMEVIIGTDNRTRINPTTSYPWRAICRLRIKSKSGKEYLGTGWFIGPGTVVTAGHCVYLHADGGWAASIEVIPGANELSRPYGSVTSSNLKSVTGWTVSKNRNNDYGAIILPSNAKLGNRVGWFGFCVKDNAFIKSKVLNLSGYPGDKYIGGWGNTQWFHSLKPKSISDRVITYDIDTMGGQSGSPVWYLDGTSRYAVGIHTNGMSSGNSATRIVKAVFDNLINWKSLGS